MNQRFEEAKTIYKKLGIDTIWDLGIDVSLNKINNDIDSNNAFYRFFEQR